MLKDLLIFHYERLLGIPCFSIIRSMGCLCYCFPACKPKFNFFHSRNEVLRKSVP